MTSTTSVQEGDIVLAGSSYFWVRRIREPAHPGVGGEVLEGHRWSHATNTWGGYQSWRHDPEVSAPLHVLDDDARSKLGFPATGPVPSWTHTDPDSGEELGVYDTADGQQALHAPRYDGDPQPYHDSGVTGRRYRPDQVGAGFAGAAQAGLARSFGQFTDTPDAKGHAMTNSIDGTASTEDIAAKLGQASDELEDIAAANDQLRQSFENHEWSGLDDLAQARAEIDQARDELTEVARKVGLAGQVGQAFRDNRKVGNKESLGRS